MSRPRSHPHYEEQAEIPKGAWHASGGRGVYGSGRRTAPGVQQHSSVLAVFASIAANDILAS